MSGSSRRGGRSALVHRQSVLGRGELGSSLLFVFPLFLVYEASVVFAAPTMNGADFATRWLWQAVDGDKRVYLLGHGVLALVFLGALLWMRSRNTLALRGFLSMLLESAIYALTLGSFISLVMRDLLGFEQLAMALAEVGHALVISLGAGVHEELVFRLGLFAGGAWLIRAAGITHAWAVMFALLASSVLFSAAHHVVEPFVLTVFVYRTIAGVVFGLLFYYRSFAHAVYTHFLYDLYVFVLRGP